MWIFFKKQMQEKITQASLFLGRKKKELSQCNVKKKKRKTPTERHTDTKHRCFFKEEDK